MGKIINRSAVKPAQGATLWMRQLSLAAACVVAMQGATAAQVSLNQVIPIALPNHDTELRLVFSSTPPEPQAYQIDQPTRLVLDFPNTISALPNKNLVIGNHLTRDINVVDNQERTRMVIGMRSAGNYTTRVEGNTLVLKISPTTAVGSVVAAAPVVQAMPAVAASDIANIGFQRSASGDGQVVVDLINSALPVDVQQQGSKIVVRFLGSKIPASLRRRLDVNDFATPVSTVDAYNENGNGVLMIQPQGNFEYMAYQTDNKLTISVKRPVSAKAAVKTKTDEVYSGQKLSLNFQDIDIRSVLQLIADFTNLNLVASDSVNGRITLRLQNVPWDQALDIILKTKGLDKRRTGNVVMVAPATEITAREKLEAQASQQVEQLAPLQTEYIQLSYAKATDIQTLITSGRNNGTSSNAGANLANAAGGENNVGSLLSSRGTISIDPRTNTLIIQDTAKKIDEIRDMIARLDVPVKQVMIEARIVSATDSFSKEMGVKWGVVSQGAPRNSSLLVGAKNTTIDKLTNPTANTVRGGYDYGINFGGDSNDLNVDLGVSQMANPASIALGLISLSDVMLDLEISALQADGKGEVIATPKILTGDKQKARIASGEQIPYQNATSSGATAIQFVNAELSLEVTPSITPDGKINMELFVNSDTRGEPVPGGVAINTNRIATNVLINDGETVVLGGIFKNTTGNQIRRVPFLSDLPMVGNLFKNKYNVDNKQELLIFVTPRLVNDTSPRTPR